MRPRHAPFTQLTPGMQGRPGYKRGAFNGANSTADTHRAERKRHMAISPLAGKPAPKDLLVDLAKLERAYHDRRPDVGDANQLVAFGTSGHRGSPLSGTFTEAHILAITQAICEY